ncbi:MAG: ribonuclease H-like domain-containing protein [Candidatus Kaiserbacteria bacterium]|nr:ribonuclease H-like domain-containing protein [Candidatus Kaiserbacteria bacterium]
MRGLVFDIETADVFSGDKKNPEDLTLAVVAVYSYPDDIYEAYTQETLPDLWNLMRSVDTLIGFNNNHFDTPLLNKYAPMDLTKEYRSIDILESVRQSLGRRIRLDWIAEGTLGEKKSGDGLQSVTWWNNGEVEKVKQYCIDDVKITKQIFDYAKKHGALKYADLGSVHTIPVDTSTWDNTPDTPEQASVGLF